MSQFSPQYQPKLAKPKGTPVLVGKQMSAALRERLRRSGRSFKSPVICKPDNTSLSSSVNMADTVVVQCNINNTRTTPNPTSIDCKTPLPKQRLSYKFKTPVTNTKNCIHDNESPLVMGRLQTTQIDGLQKHQIQAHEECSTPISSSKYNTKRRRLSTCSGIDNKIGCDTSQQTKESSKKYATVTVCSQSSICDQTGDQSEDTHLKQLKKEKLCLLQNISRKEEQVRKLKLVKLYRSKNDLATLEELIGKWRTLSQEALEELLKLAPDPKPTIVDLLLHLHIDPKFIQYNQENECFY